MAISILAISRTSHRNYRLPESVRQWLVQESSLRPTACIAPKRLAVVERQRLRFIAAHGSDGCSGGS